MRRRSIAEVLTGAVVLLVAAGFLGYAVAHSGRSSVSGYELRASRLVFAVSEAAAHACGTLHEHGVAVRHVLRDTGRRR